MTQTFLPVDGGSYSEGDWHGYAKFWLGEGILNGELHASTLQAFGDSSGLQVKVRAGRAFVQAGKYENSAEATVAIATANATNPRIDRIVLRLDFTANTCVLAAVAGTAAVSPTAPVLTRNATTWELSLAQVAVAALASAIAPGDVTDERFDPSLCGFARAMYPLYVCKSATKPATHPPGGMIYLEDTKVIQVNTNTLASPTWVSVSGLSTGNPGASAVGDAAAPGTSIYAPHLDHVHAREGFGLPAASAVGDAQTAGTALTVPHSDHKHAREAFAVPAIVLGSAAAAGAATTPIRSDATIVAFDATTPAANVLGSAGSVGAAAVAPRRDHVHPDLHQMVVKTASESVVNNTLQDDDHLINLVVASGGRYALEALILVQGASVTPGIKLGFVCSTAPSVVAMGGYGYDSATGTVVVPSFTNSNSGTLNHGTINGPYPIFVKGHILMGGTGGTLKLQWAEVVVDAAGISVLAGSYIVLHKLN